RVRGTRDRLAARTRHHRQMKARMARSDKGLDDISALARAIRAGERAMLARAITLIESKRTDHQKAARALVQELLPATGRAIRVGITGMPGVGKSTTIDALGTFLTGKGHRVAVLTIDPSSTRTDGSSPGRQTRVAPQPPSPHPLHPPPPPPPAPS